MKLLSTVASVAISAVWIAKCSAAAPFLSEITSPPSRSSGIGSVFGIARGGGVFGRSKNKEGGPSSPAEAKDALRDQSGATHPAMTREEIEEWLSHIPVFAVTDPNGAGVILKPDDDTAVMYFFFSPQMANATLNQLKSVDDSVDLKISAFSLGKIWYNVLNKDGDQNDIQTKKPGAADDSEAEVLASVESRLVPDARDLIGARMMLTMTPEDGEEMKKAGGAMTPALEERVVQKAMRESPAFKENYNEIPVFVIRQMRLQRRSGADGEGGGEAKTILPLYFDVQTMLATWQQFVSSVGGDDPNLKDMEPAMNVLNLKELVKMMEAPSEIDFRSCFLLPPSPGGGGAGTPSAGTGAAPSSAEAQMAGTGGGGGTLGDI